MPSLASLFGRNSSRSRARDAPQGVTESHSNVSGVEQLADPVQNVRADDVSMLRRFGGLSFDRDGRLRPGLGFAAHGLGLHLNDQGFTTTGYGTSFVNDEGGDLDENVNPADNELMEQERLIEDMVIDIVRSGQGEDRLKPNSSQSVQLGEHHMCFSCSQDPGSDYRVWEWHGHVMLYKEEEGYVAEYVYGIYYEPLFEEEGVEAGLRTR